MSGLIEKLEWVQLTHTDHTALAHLEDRIATLVKRLDASDSRVSDCSKGSSAGSPICWSISNICAARKSERARPRAANRSPPTRSSKRSPRTQDSLEAVQGTVEHVVDRLAMIESDMRVDRARTALSEPSRCRAGSRKSRRRCRRPEPARVRGGRYRRSFRADLSARTAVEAVGPAQPEPQHRRRLAVARTPIDPNLPPDHPLEPGFRRGRSRNQPSAADRIAASEAAVGSKPPVIPDPGGGKPDFIAAARRAARAAAVGRAERANRAQHPPAVRRQPKKMTRTSAHADGSRQPLSSSSSAASISFRACSRMAARRADIAGAASHAADPNGAASAAEPSLQPPETPRPQVQMETPGPPARSAPDGNPQPSDAASRRRFRRAPVLRYRRTAPAERRRQARSRKPVPLDPALAAGRHAAAPAQRRDR